MYKKRPDCVLVRLAHAGPELAVPLNDRVPGEDEAMRSQSALPSAEMLSGNHTGGVSGVRHQAPGAHHSLFAFAESRGRRCFNNLRTWYGWAVPTADVSGPAGAKQTSRDRNAQDEALSACLWRFPERDGQRMALRTARASSTESSARRKHRERMSPTAGLQDARVEKASHERLRRRDPR